MKINGKWGLIKTNGEFVLGLEYDKIQPVANENGRYTYRATKGSATTYHNDTGELTLKPEVDKSGFLKCRGDSRLFVQDGQWGMIDNDGDVLIAAKYPLMSCFKNGIAWVPDMSKRAWCPIDKTGNRPPYPICKETYYPYYQTHSYPETFHPEPFENSVLWTRQYFEYGAGTKGEPPRMIPDGHRPTSSIHGN